MPANWVFMAIPTGLACLGYLLMGAIEYWREQQYLRAVFDGDRIQRYKIDRKYNKRRIATHTGRRFY